MLIPTPINSRQGQKQTQRRDHQRRAQKGRIHGLSSFIRVSAIEKHHRWPALASLILCLSALIFTGCIQRHLGRVQTVDQAIVNELQSPPKAPEKKGETYDSEGSLWMARSTYNELFVNPKANAVGDIVTIKIVESAEATNKAATDTGRETSVDAGITSFLGLEKQYTDTSHPHYTAYPKINPFGKIAASTKNDFKGSGSTQRSGDLTAYLTARVTEVLPNGNLRVAGFREVKINNEVQIILLSGIIRPRDISPENMVESTYIADARISYSGAGIVNQRQRPGWMANFIDAVWPF
jgi:flagellar L-ring protein precursor FlgH